MAADFFRGPRVEALRPIGVEHVLHFTSLLETAPQSVASDPARRVQIDSHRVLLKKSAGPSPDVELRPMGPRLELTLRRVRLPTSDLWKRACKQPKEAKVSANVDSDVFNLLAKYCFNSYYCDLLFLN